jgi:hypothetical protein
MNNNNDNNKLKNINDTKDKNNLLKKEIKSKKNSEKKNTEKINRGDITEKFQNLVL